MFRPRLAAEHPDSVGQRHFLELDLPDGISDWLARWRLGGAGTPHGPLGHQRAGGPKNAEALREPL